jgi:hypothetical protein
VANSFIKAEQVLAQLLGVLQRDTVLAQFVWRGVPDAAFKGAKDDTVTIRLPAYVNARTRVLRSGTAITVDDLDETSVDVVLDTHVYKAVGVTDENMTLDIVNFGEQVAGPVSDSIVRKIDDLIADEIANADYEVTETLDPDDPYPGIVDARIDLNNANVPATGRFLAVGSNVEAALLKSDRLSKFDLSGSPAAFREAVIGRIAGFDAVSCVALDPDAAVAAHSTAFPLATVVPVVPMGAPWGATAQYRGFGLRTLRHYDPTASGGPKDVLLTDCFMGLGVTKDAGTIDGDGKFQPSTSGSDTPILVRAVGLTLGS